MRSGDVVVTMGAGDVTMLGPEIVDGARGTGQPVNAAPQSRDGRAMTEPEDRSEATAEPEDRSEATAEPEDDGEPTVESDEDDSEATAEPEDSPAEDFEGPRRRATAGTRGAARGPGPRRRDRAGPTRSQAACAG